MGGREKFGYPVLDCDGHITEPLAIWSEYLEPKYREAAKEHFSIQNGADGAFWTVEEFEGPGADAAYSRGPGRGGLTGGGICRAGAYRAGRTVEEIGNMPTDGEMWGPESGYMNPGGFDPHARIKEMDEMGGDKADKDGKSELTQPQKEQEVIKILLVRLMLLMCNSVIRYPSCFSILLPPYNFILYPLVKDILKQLFSLRLLF